MTTQLIPATQFQVKKINQLFALSESHGALIKGYGIWDKLNKGWVSLNSVVEGVTVPYCLPRKASAMEAIKDGLYNDYQLVKP